jgi:hypothetical protein
LEATLRLLHSYSESGLTHNEITSQSDFAFALSALQHTDVQMHPHVQVQLVFFEVSVRYVKLLGEHDAVGLVESLFSRLQSQSRLNRPKNTYMDMLRSRFSLLALKLAEALENKSFLLLRFTDVLQGNAKFPCSTVYFCVFVVYFLTNTSIDRTLLYSSTEL